MKKLGVVNSDPELKKQLDDVFSHNPGNMYELLYLDKQDEILDFLNYTLPELLIINFSDSVINIEEIIDHLQHDKWILNPGIIGIFSHEKNKEEELLKKYKAVNILTLLEYYRIKSHLIYNIQIIEKNYQVIFQASFSGKFLDGASGSFILDNDLLAVPLYSGICAIILAQRGLLNPDSKMRLQLALAELIVNAIEHGNCGITYEEKTKAAENGNSFAELILEKCKDPIINAKKVILHWEIKKDKSIFIIQDEGDGFDVKLHIEKVKSQNSYSSHGRGIKIASKIASELKYNAKGNQAALIVKHDTNIEHDVPVGFSREQIVIVKEGDIVLREGEPSDFLYYISSGSYEALHNNKRVGILTSQDIFMGEMSFLLDQRRSATIRTTSAGKLIRLTKKNFINVIRDYPHYGIFLSKLLAKRIIRNNEQIALLEKLQPDLVSNNIKNI